MHGVDKGIDPNIQQEKQVIKPIISSEVKGMTQNKPRLGQGRAGIKWKIKPHISSSLSKPIQSIEWPILWWPLILHSQKTTSNVSFPDSRGHDKFTPIPQTRSAEDSNTKMINRENIWNISRDIPPYQDPIYRPPSKLVEIPLQETPWKLTDLDTDINTDFKENSP